MFQNTVLGFVVCGLSMALGACAYGADEAAPVGEQSSALVAADARMEQVKKLPSVELAEKQLLENADPIASIKMKGLERADGLPEIVMDQPLLPDLFVPGSLAKPEVPVLTREGTFVGQLDVEQQIQVRQQPIVRLSGEALIPAGNPCDACKR